MQRYNFIFFVIFLTACAGKQKFDSYSKAYFKEWKIPLMEGRGEIDILLNRNLDTFFMWTQHSDCGEECDQIVYRIQSKRLPIFKESGFMYSALEDSVDQFSIKHSKLSHQSSATDTGLLKLMISDLHFGSFPKGNILIDTLLKINNRDFAVYSVQKFDSVPKIMTLYLNAETSISGNVLKFYFESRKSYKDSSTINFFSDAFTSLKTIKITNGR